MKNAIKKAIEGGYRNHSINQGYILFDGLENSEVFVNGYGYVFLHKKGDEAEDGLFQNKSDSFRKEEILIDPTFWQCLGKALGWEHDQMKCKVCDPYEGTKCSQYTYDNLTIHRKYWHRFIDHLAKGKDIDSFFNELIK